MYDSKKIIYLQSSFVNKTALVPHIFRGAGAVLSVLRFFVVVGNGTVKGIEQGVHVFFVLTPDGAIFSDMLFFTVSVVGLGYGLRGRLVAEQVIGGDAEMAGNAQNFVLTDGAMPFFDSAQGASVNAYDLGELTLLHIVVCPEVGNSLSNLLIAHNPHPDFAILTNLL